MKKQRKGFYHFSQAGFVESEVPVPFYVNGTGISQSARGKIEQKRGILNQSSGFLWVLSGTLEIYDGPKLVTAEPGHVCFSLAGEDLWHRVLSEECTFRWLTLAGPLAEAVLSNDAGPQAVKSNANARIHADKTARFIAVDPSFPDTVHRQQGPAHRGIYKINLIYHITSGGCPLPRCSKMRVKSVCYPGK